MHPFLRRRAQYGGYRVGIGSVNLVGLSCFVRLCGSKRLTELTLIDCLRCVVAAQKEPCVQPHQSTRALIWSELGGAWLPLLETFGFSGDTCTGGGVFDFRVRGVSALVVGKLQFLQNPQVHPSGHGGREGSLRRPHGLGEAIPTIVASIRREPKAPVDLSRRAFCWGWGGKVVSLENAVWVRSHAAGSIHEVDLSAISSRVGWNPHATWLSSLRSVAA